MSHLIRGFGVQIRVAHNPVDEAHEDWAFRSWVIRNRNQLADEIFPPVLTQLRRPEIYGSGETVQEERIRVELWFVNWDPLLLCRQALQRVTSALCGLGFPRVRLHRLSIFELPLLLLRQTSGLGKQQAYRLFRVIVHLAGIIRIPPATIPRKKSPHFVAIANVGAESRYHSLGVA
jgi:hypothetical protein